MGSHQYFMGPLDVRHRYLITVHQYSSNRRPTVASPIEPAGRIVRPACTGRDVRVAPGCPDLGNGPPAGREHKISTGGRAAFDFRARI